jgi:alkylation response protein AidB-like acyl-CoA dehydrogenase
MTSYLKDNDDLGWYLEKGLDLRAVAEASERRFGAGGFESAEEAVELYKATLELVGEFAAEAIAPLSLCIDREGVQFENGEVKFPETLASLFEKIRGLELHGMCVPRELGGQNAPMLLYFINTELLARADVSVMAHHGFHGGIAMAMLLLSLHEGTTKLDPETGEVLETRFADYIEEIRRGDAWGSMDITEPNAGSDMAKLQTVGIEDEHGNWFVTGQKIFITSGHGKYHFVIARTEKVENPDDPRSGLGGLSMFLVPAYEDLPDGTRRRIVALDRIEEKMGHHGSATCALSFERAPAHLIGKRGDGFKYMLILMNNARLGVGFECLGLCEAAYRLARDYAAERRSMGKTLDRHEMIADYLDQMKTEIQGLRALAMHGAFHEELAAKKQLRIEHGTLSELEQKRLGREVAEHRAEARRVTPLLKYLAAEKAVEMARRAMQILGGVGYVKEYGAEKLLRDATVMPIYEGTSQIQSLMAMKDVLGKVMKSPQAFVKRVAQTRWRALSARDPLERRVAKLQYATLAAQRSLLTETAGAKLSGLPWSEWPSALTRSWDPKRDFAPALLHAERLTQLLADVAIVEILFDQSKRDPARQDVLERYLERAEPRARFLALEMRRGRRLLAELERDREELRAAE